MVREYVVGRTDKQYVFSLGGKIVAFGEDLRLDHLMTGASNVPVADIVKGNSHYEDLPRGEDVLRNAREGEVVGKSRTKLSPLDQQDFERADNLFDAATTMAHMSIKG